jgi:uroporphyrinogen decarboxylase
MYAKEIIQSAVAGRRPSRNAVALLSSGAWTFNQHGYTLEDVLGQPGLMAELIINTQARVQSDMVWVGSGYHNLVARPLGGALKFRKRGTPDIVAPILQHPHAGAELSLAGIADDNGIQGLWETARRVVQAVGQEVLVGASQWGAFTLGAQFFGVERMMRSLYRDQEGAHAVLAFATEVIWRYLEPYLDAGVEVISIADPTASGDMISREQFQTFVFPYQRELIRRLRERGVLVTVHICGNITNRLDLIVEAGAHIVSVDYKVDLHDAKAATAGRAAFAGNLNPVAIMQQSTPEGVVAAAQAALASVGQDGNYILMPGCDIPPTTPIENVQALIETGRAWRHAETAAGVNG